MRYLEALVNKRELPRNGFLIDCKEIRLVQNGVAVPRSWLLTGALRVDFREGISARLVSFSDDRPIFSPFQTLIEEGAVKSGEIYPNSRYFSMTAIDVDGGKWENPSVEVTESPGKNCTVVNINCDWIRKTQDVSNEKNYVYMLFLDELKFPLNEVQSTEITGAIKKSSRIDHAGSSGVTKLASIRYAKADIPDDFCVFYASVNDDVNFSTYFPSKLVETIRFVTASTASYCACESICDGVSTLEFAKVPDLAKGIFPSPLIDDRMFTVEFYRLFDAFLDYSIRVSPEERSSPLATKFYPLYQLGRVSLDSIALLVSVTVEGVLKSEFKALGKPEQGVLSEVDEINEAIDQLKIRDSTKDRAKGSLGGMKDSRAVDKLFSLKDRGVLWETEITAWKDLRNTSAHGGKLHIPPEKLQELLDNVYTASTLLNKLAMLAIGYCGKYTDYSTKGWPEKDLCVCPHPPSKVPLL
jgi:hypothetical protein